MAQWGERTVELSTLWVAPVRAVLEEQQELIDAVASWAEEQRKWPTASPRWPPATAR